MKTLSIIKYSFATIGLVMLVGTFFMYQHTREFVVHALTAQGVVVDFETHRSDGSTMYAPVVSFHATDGQEYQFVSSVSSSSPAYNRNEEVEVLYQENNPQAGKINSFFMLHLGELILGFLGSVFFLIGGGIIAAGYFKNKKRDFLQLQGVPIQAKFQSVELNTSLSVNGRNPYVIVCQWLNPATNELHEFESDNIWFDPEEFIKSETMTVLIEQNNPKNYWMDINFLPKKA